MSKVVMMTDSACDIPAELEAKYGIEILPFTLSIDGKSYVERHDFSNEEYYELLAHCEGIPSTAQITMMRFEEKFREFAENGCTDVIYVSINAGGSGTYNAARMAVANILEETPDFALRVHIVDGHNYSMAYGWPVCEAARKIQCGAAVPEILEYLEDILARMEVVVSVYTLKYIKKSGRVSAAAAFAGELLGLRPIITIIDGETKTAAKVRGDAAVMPALAAHTKKKMTQGGKYLVACTDIENGKMLAKICKKELGFAPEEIFLLGPAVSTNTGPDAVAIVFVGEKRR